MCLSLGLLSVCSERDQANTLGIAEEAQLVNTITNNSILAPVKLVVVGDKLMMMQGNTSHIFYFFSLPEAEFLYSWGIRGEGPEDFRAAFEGALNVDGVVFFYLCL